MIRVIFLTLITYKQVTFRFLTVFFDKSITSCFLILEQPFHIDGDPVIASCAAQITC